MKATFNQFLDDLDVKKCIDLISDQNIIDLLGLNENRTSDLIAWLLNPTEWHRQGGVFLQNLLLACLDADSKRTLLTKRAIFRKNAFENVLVYREFGVNVESSKGYVDIIVLLPSLDTCLVIENKIGALEGEEQTKKYHDALHEKLRRAGYEKRIYVFMDIFENTASDKRWISLSYEWLFLTILNLPHPKELPQRAEHLLFDFHKIWNDDVEVDSEEDELLQRLTKVRKRYDKIIPELEEQWNSTNFCRILPSSSGHQLKGITKASQNLLYFMWQNELFMERLLALNCFDEIELYLRKILPDKKDVICIKKISTMFVNRTSWEEMYVDPDHYWGIQLKVALDTASDQIILWLHLRGSNLSRPEVASNICEKWEMEFKENIQRFQVAKEEFPQENSEAKVAKTIASWIDRIQAVIDCIEY